MRLLEERYCMRDCAVFSWSFAWIVVVLAWIISGAIALGHWYRFTRPEPFLKNPPKGTNKWSIPTWLVYFYACLSQLSPVGMMSRVVSANYSRLILDTYILSWGTLAVMVLKWSAEETYFWTALFLEIY